jgi:hypothetical protein
MANDAIDRVRAGQPDPEVDPAVAGKYAAVVATGRSDFPNQINNVLAFPGVFRGALRDWNRLYAPSPSLTKQCSMQESSHKTYSSSGLSGWNTRCRGPLPSGNSMLLPAGRRPPAVDLSAFSAPAGPAVYLSIRVQSEIRHIQFSVMQRGKMNVRTFLPGRVFPVSAVDDQAAALQRKPAAVEPEDRKAPARVIGGAEEPCTFIQREVTGDPHPRWEACRLSAVSPRSRRMP